MVAVTRLGSGQLSPRVAYVASFPPRECGIATFTRDLVSANNRLVPELPGRIVAINDPGPGYRYPASVRWQIDRDEVSTYTDAADYLNDSACDVVNIQHEYGLFAGPWGSYLFRF